MIKELIENPDGTFTLKEVTGWGSNLTIDDFVFEDDAPAQPRPAPPADSSGDPGQGLSDEEFRELHHSVAAGMRLGDRQRAAWEQSKARDPDAD